MSYDRLDERVMSATSERAFLLAELQHVIDHPNLFSDPEAELARLTVELRELQGNGAPIDWRALSARSTWEDLAAREADAR